MKDEKMWKRLAVTAVILSVLFAFGCGQRSAGKKIASYQAQEIGHSLSHWKDDIYLDVEPIGADLPGENTVSVSAGKYMFSYHSDGDTVTYVVDTNSQKVKSGLIHVTARLNEQQEITALTDGGTAYRDADLKDYSPVDFAQSADVRFCSGFDNGVLTLDYYETYQEITTHKSYRLYIKGKTLICEVFSDCTNYKNGYAQFVTGHAEQITAPRLQKVAYHEDIPVIVVDNSYFLTTYVDLANSNATSKDFISGTKKNEQVAYTGQSTVYGKNTAGTVNPLGERLYITVSSEITDCLSYSSNEKSTYRDTLTDKVILDVWQSNSEARYSDTLPLAEKYGLDDVLTIFHRWQRDGYDNSNPVFFPASEVWGGNAALQKTFSALQQQGWMTALHEDYWFVALDEANDYLYESDIADRLCKSSSFQPLPGWNNTNTGISGWTIMPGAMQYYAEKNSPLIKETFGTNACYLDVSGARWPDSARTVTFDAGSTTSRSLKQSVQETGEFFTYLENLYQGPVFSEGAETDVTFQAALSGLYCGSEREIPGQVSGLIMPDYEVKYVRLLAAHQGMGYQKRFYTVSDPSSSDYPWDAYNSMAIAYAHAGFIQQYEYDLDAILNTYYMFRAIQEQYLDTSASAEVMYVDGDGELSLSQAVAQEYNFNKPRLHIIYSNGLELYMNFDSASWKVTLNGEEYELDRFGYVAENPARNFLQYSCVRDGHRVDFVDSEYYTYANGRGTETDFGTFSACNQKIVKKSGRLETLRIVDLSAEALHRTGALLGFDTNLPCYVSVYYGENEPNALFQGAYELSTSHELDLRGKLKANTTYRYYVVAEDLYGNTVKTEVRQFTTLGSTGDELGKPYMPALMEVVDSSAAFSDVQGDNNWYYFEYNDRAYQPLYYNFGTNAWTSSTATITEVGAVKMHPSETAAVRAYKAPASGTLRITISVDRYTDNGDGIRFSVLRNDDIVYPSDAGFATLEPTEKINDVFEVHVQEGDYLYFVVHRGARYTYDSTNNTVKLQYTQID